MSEASHPNMQFQRRASRERDVVVQPLVRVRTTDKAMAGRVFRRVAHTLKHITSGEGAHMTKRVLPTSHYSTFEGEGKRARARETGKLSAAAFGVPQIWPDSNQLDQLEEHQK